MDIGIVNCGDWSDFKYKVWAELFGRDQFRKGVYIFRGQRNADWDLIPIFDRLFGELTGDERLQAQKRLFDCFRTECEAFEFFARLLSNELNVLALGQHYGLPTRLLDWSESPYIAAYFAFSDCLLAGEVNGELSIWALDTRHDIWSGDQGVKIVGVPSIDNVRLRNQHGRFSYSQTPFKGLKEYVTYCTGDGKSLLKFVLPQADVVRALADLEMMGITPSRLFPGIEGAAAAAKLRVLYEHCRS